MASRSVSRYDDMDPPKPRNDAYTGLLTVSFIAMLIGCTLLFIDFYSFDGMSPAKVKDKLGAIKGGGAERKGGGDGGAPPQPKVEKDPPKAAPPEAKEKDVKKDEAKEMKKDEAKKDDAKDMKKDEAKKDDAKKDDAKEKKE